MSTTEALQALLDLFHQGRAVPDSPGSEGYVGSIVEQGEAALAATSAPSEPAQWKLVPWEPTADMLSAARVNREYASCTEEQVWSAMLAAAPNYRTGAAEPMVDMMPPATARDRWMYEQGRRAERDPRTHAPQPAPAVPQPEAPAEPVSAVLPRRATDLEIRGWAKRHDLDSGHMGELREAFEDAASLRMTFATPPAAEVEERRELSTQQISDIARDAQIAFCLGKFDSFEMAFARGLLAKSKEKAS